METAKNTAQQFCMLKWMQWARNIDVYVSCREYFMEFIQLYWPDICRMSEGFVKQRYVVTSCCLFFKMTITKVEWIFLFDQKNVVQCLKYWCLILYKGLKVAWLQNTNQTWNIQHYCSLCTFIKHIHNMLTRVHPQLFKKNNTLLYFHKY